MCMSLGESERTGSSVLSSLRQLLRAERERTVPAQINVLHYLGALSLVSLVVQFVTGILLLVYYRPSATGAYYSTSVIMDDVRLGWLMRSLHHWGSDLLLLLLLLHMGRVYFSRAYQAPRQLNWMVGVVLLILVGTLAFTGILLPWDQYAYWYVDAARKTISAIPVLGNLLLGLLWGGWDLGEEVLLRFYALHVGVLPWMVLGLLSFHWLMVWRFGIKPPAGETSAAQSPRMLFYPDFLVNLLIAFLLVFGVLFSLAVFFPPSLLQQANPVSPLAQAQPKWFLLPLRGLLRGLPGPLAALSVAAFLVILTLVPIIDRNPSQTFAKKVIHWGLGCLFFVAGVVLGVNAYFR